MVRETPLVYTAGKMEWSGDDSHWRTNLDPVVEGVNFVHPTETYNDHGGDLIEGCVAEDLSIIGMADGLVAYITDSVQIGTVTETLHAVKSGKPALLMFEDGGLQMTEETPSEIDSGVSMRARQPNYWFLINYLSGDPSATPTHGDVKRPHLSHRSWDGFSNATISMNVDDKSVNETVDEWTSDVWK